MNQVSHSQMMLLTQPCLKLHTHHLALCVAALRERGLHGACSLCLGYEHEHSPRIHLGFPHLPTLNEASCFLRDSRIRVSPTTLRPRGRQTMLGKRASLFCRQRHQDIWLTHWKTTTKTTRCVQKAHLEAMADPDCCIISHLGIFWP